MAAAKQNQDQRIAPRVPFCVKVRVTHRGELRDYHSVDLSVSGMFLETTQPLPEGSEAQLFFMVGNGALKRHIEVQARVVRVVNSKSAAERGCLPGMGMLFTKFLSGQGDLSRELSRRVEGFRHQPLDKQAAEKWEVWIQSGFSVSWGSKPPPDRFGKIVDVSGLQAFLSTDLPVAPGTRIYMLLELPTANIPQRIRTVAFVEHSNLQNRPENDEPIGMLIHFEIDHLEDPEILQTIQRHLARRRESIENQRRVDRLIAEAEDGLGNVEVPVEPESYSSAQTTHQENELDTLPPQQKDDFDWGSVKAQVLAVRASEPPPPPEPEDEPEPRIEATMRYDVNEMESLLRMTKDVKTSQMPAMRPGAGTPLVGTKSVEPSAPKPAAPKPATPKVVVAKSAPPKSGAPKQDKPLSSFKQDKAPAPPASAQEKREPESSQDKATMKYKAGAIPFSPELSLLDSKVEPEAPPKNVWLSTIVVAVVVSIVIVILAWKFLK